MNTRLWRPVGLKELELIELSGWKKFPPRLTWQPIFYPVLNFEYAAQIARDWNTNDPNSDYSGFVTTFEIPTEYFQSFEVQNVGGHQHNELWVPAEQLEEFNAKIQEPIKVEAAYYGDKYAGPKHYFSDTENHKKATNLATGILVIDNFWTDKECDDFIIKSEALGFEPAKVETENGYKLIETVRNNYRIIYEDENLARILWQQVAPFAPSAIGNSEAIGLNEVFRIYKYQAGQQFRRHKDQSFIRNESEASYYTFMIYLNENFTGGQTVFNAVTIEPKKRMAILFLHQLEHEGLEVKEGVKYVLRTDIMYCLSK